MNPHESFDRELRDLFRDYQPEVPADAWSRLQDAQKKKRPNGWWNPARTGLFFAAVCISGIAVWYVAFSNQLNTHRYSEQTSGTSATTPITPAAQQQNKMQEASGAQQAATKSAVNQTTSLLSVADATDPTSNTSAATSKTPAGNSDITGTSDVLKTSTPSGKKSASGTYSNSSGATSPLTYSADFKKKRNYNNQNAIAVNQPVLDSDQSNINASPDVKPEEKSTTKNRQQRKQKGAHRFRINPSESENSIQDNDVAAAGKIVKPVLSQDQNRQHLMAEASKIYAASLANQTRTSITSGGIPGCPKADLDAAGNKDYLEFYAGPDLARKHYSDTGQSMYLQRRKESTQTLLSWSAGVRYTRVFNNGVSFRTGFNYSQINERFRYVNSNTVQMNYEIDPYSGDTLAVTRVTGTRYKTTYNRFRSLDIPLLLGYEMGTGRLHVNLNAGLLVNIYNWQKGDVLDTSYHPVSITTGKGNAQYMYKTNAGLGFTGGASVYYRLTDRYHLLAEPYFRYHFAPISNSALSLQEKFTTLGIRLGLRVDF